MIGLPVAIPSNRSRMALEKENLGLSGLACPRCKEHLTKYEEEMLLTYYLIDHNCGKEIYIEDAKVRILPRYQHLLDLNRAHNQPFWYHATNISNWPTNVTDKPDDSWLAHIGSKESALDRAKSRDYTHMFKVKIDPSANWSPYVTDDWNEWPETGYDLWKEVYQKFSEVTRYVNRYEIPGSISLLVASDLIRVVGCEQIKKATTEETHRDTATRKPTVHCA